MTQSTRRFARWRTWGIQRTEYTFRGRQSMSTDRGIVQTQWTISLAKLFPVSMSGWMSHDHCDQTSGFWRQMWCDGMLATRGRVTRHCRDSVTPCLGSDETAKWHQKRWQCCNVCLWFKRLYLLINGCFKGHVFTQTITGKRMFDLSPTLRACLSVRASMNRFGQNLLAQRKF